MMAKYTPDTISSGFNSNSKINENFNDVAAELNNKVLYRDNPVGEPNNMETNLDMNSNRIQNLPSPVNDNEPARWIDVKNGVVGISEAVPGFTGNNGAALSTNGTSFVFKPFLTHFDSVADMVSDTDLIVGQKVVTNGYYTPGDGGWNAYEIVAAATGTDDGGSFIDLTTHQAQGLFPDGIVRTSQFGARGDGVTDDLATINAAVAYIKTLADAGKEAVLHIIDDPALSATLTLDASDASFYFYGEVKALSGFSAGTFLIDVTGSRVHLFNPRLEGSSLAAGIDVSGGSIQVHDPVIDHFHTYGIRLAGSSGDSNVYNPKITQWSRTDSEFEFDANFDATAIYVDRGDCEVRGGITRWCGKCIHLGPNSNTFWLTHHHPYNGRPSGDPGGPRVDPVLVEIDDGASGTVIHECYLDNGLVKLFSPAVQLHNCSFLINDSAVTFTDQEAIQVFANGQTQPFQLNISTKTVGTIPAGYTMIAYKDNGPNSWTGDYSAIDVQNNLYLQNINGRYTVQHRNADDVPFEHSYKPTGNIIKKYQVGTATATQVTYDGTNVTTDADIFRVESLTGSVAQLFLGSSSNGLSESGTGTVTIRAGATGRVDFVNNGVVRPTSDNAQNLGSGSNRWAEVFAGTGTINTSDEREKTPIEGLSSAELATAVSLRASLGKFKFTDAVALKGDGARVHFGIGAQTVRDVFAANGLDADDYGLFCYDEWNDEYDADGNLVVEAGNRYGIRYDELMAFILCAL